MSVQAMAWALQQQIVTHHTSRHVLLVLANYADQEGRSAFPSVRTLARETGLSDRAVSKYLRELEDAGAITRGNQAVAAAHIARGDRRPVVYDMPVGTLTIRENCPQRDEQHSPREAERGEQCAPREAPRHEQRSPRDGNGVNNTTERGEQCSENPPLIHQLKTTELDRGTPGARGTCVENPLPDLGSFQLAVRSPRFEQAALAFIASKGGDTWRAWFGSAGLTGADPPCLEVESEFVASHLRTHFIDFFEARCGQKIIIKVNQARRARRARQERGGRHAAR